MLVIVLRLIRALLRARPLTIIMILFVFATSWPLMAMAEPAGADIVRPANYWWWFLVTSSTVGYGDLYPVSVVGHLVGVYVIIGGIATLTTLFAQLATTLEQTKGRRMKGAITVTASGHIVLCGYTPGRTERIVDELLAEGGRQLVLCVWDEVDSHPMPDRPVEFVRGDLTDDAVLRRAGVPEAASVLIDARDDNEALAIAVTVDHIAPAAHLVVPLRDLARASHLHYVNTNIHCVQWHSPRLVTEELQSPGISQVYTELMSHGGGNTYSVTLPALPEPLSFGDCQVTLGRHFDATVLAARTGEGLLVSPPWSTSLSAGTLLYYVSRRKIEPDQLSHAFSAR